MEGIWGYFYSQSGAVNLHLAPIPSKCFSNGINEFIFTEIC